MTKFITADADSFGQKRKQSQRACEQCRKKKRRCNHDAAPGNSRTSDHLSHVPDVSLATRPSISISNQNRMIANEGQSNIDVRGVANGNENSSLSQRQVYYQAQESSERAMASSNADYNDQRDNSSEAGENLQHLNSRFIGDLNPEGVLLTATSPGATRGASSSNRIGIWLAEKQGKSATQIDLNENIQPSLFYGFTSMVGDMVLPILQGECTSCLPPPSDLDALISFYFETIHPLFPVVNENGFKNLQSTNPSRILLEQGMCLTASMNFGVNQHLKLSDQESSSSHKEFGRKLYAAMRTSIEIGLVIDKITLIQAYALMSFFMDEADGRDLSSLMCGRAVHYVHSLGLHIQNGKGSQEPDYVGRLLCCIWALDRLNAAFHGRPVLMHERDIGKDLGKCIDQQEPCFWLLLNVVILLDRIIDSYRPRRDSEESDPRDEFVPFDDLVTSGAAVQVSTTFLATIETLYHAVAILSCRSKSLESPIRSSTSYLRQTVSAGRVTSMVGHEFKGQLVLLPFVPYAVSLSLSVAYREMRRNKLPMHRARARTEFETNCNVLEELGEFYWSASVMADMGKSILRELDRVYLTAQHSQRRKSRQPGAAPQSRNSLNLNPSDRSSLQADRDATDTPQITAVDSNAIGSSLHNEFTPTADSTSSIFNDVPGFDVFEMFDPNFDLNGIDAFLEGNLDLSFPTNLQ